MRRNAKKAPIVWKDRLVFTTFSIEAISFSATTVYNSALSNDEKCLDAFAELSNGKKLYLQGISFTFCISILNGHFSTVLHPDKLLLIGSSVNILIVLSVSH